MNSRLDAVHDCLLSLDRLEVLVTRAAEAAAEEVAAGPSQAPHPPKRASHAGSHTPSTIADSM